MSHCFICGLETDIQKSKASLKSYFNIINDLMEADSQIIMSENDILCATCQAICSEMDALQYERQMLHVLLKRQMDKTYQTGDDNKKLLEIDFEALTHFETQSKWYRCKKCNFSTKMYEHVSPHYKYHNLQDKLQSKVIMPIEQVNCDSADILDPKEESLSYVNEECSDMDNTSLASFDNHDILDGEDITIYSDTAGDISQDQYSTDDNDKIVKYFTCSYCSYTGNTKTELSKHIKEAHKTERKSSTELEVFSYSKRKKYKNGYFCQYCGLRVKPNGICNHSEAIHLNFPEFLCIECNVVFYQKHLLLEHNFVVHFTCRYCYKTFTERKHVRIHERKHPKRLIYECSWCDKTFVSRNGLKFHIAIHTGLYNYECEQCEKKFSNKKALDEHVSSHTNKPRYICPICGKAFVYDASYRIHKKWHEDPYPAKCQYCPMKFRHPTILAKHRRSIHEGQTPEYKCRTCDRIFSTSSSRRCHEMMHSGNFAFRCEICDRGFSRKNHYAYHMLRIHEDDSVWNERVVCQYKVAVPPEDEIAMSADEEYSPQESVETSDKSFVNKFETFIVKSGCDNESEYEYSK